MLNPLPACTTEDGSAPDQVFPCGWDAATVGNHEGTSFVMPAADTFLYADGTLLCPTGTWANDALTGCEALPVGEPAHGPVEPMGSLLLVLAVAAGALMSAVTNRLAR
jgi:hypothetical protein